jgi:hypothetical protein
MEAIATIISKLNWPQVSLIFAIIFVLLFNKSIRDFIGRIKTVGKEGLTTESVPKSQNEEQRKKAVEELMKLGDSPLILEVEKFIRLDLQGRGLETEGDTIRILVRHLAATQLVLDFEQIHSLIFGSQIYLLKKLNEVVGQGLDREFIETHFKHVQQLFAELVSWSLEKYLLFLFGRNLITISDGKYHITVKGVEFLVWLVKTGHSENRLL